MNFWLPFMIAGYIVYSVVQIVVYYQCPPGTRSEGTLYRAGVGIIVGISFLAVACWKNRGVLWGGEKRLREKTRALFEKSREAARLRETETATKPPGETKGSSTENSVS
jgi:hypothetical protein